MGQVPCWVWGAGRGGGLHDSRRCYWHQLQSGRCPCRAHRARSWGWGRRGPGKCVGCKAEPLTVGYHLQWCARAGS